MANQMGQSMAAPPPAAAQAPPPLPADASFHVAVDGKQSGPFSVAVVQQQISSGQLSRETLVWKPGMAAWTAAGSVPELAKLFEQTPPPIPS